MELTSLEEVKTMLKNSENMLKNLDIQINNLKKENPEKSDINYQNIIIENEKLTKEHNKNLIDIKEYKSLLNELQNKINQHNSDILLYENENKNLKQKLTKTSETKTSYGKYPSINPKKSFHIFAKNSDKKNAVKIINNEPPINESKNEESKQDNDINDNYDTTIKEIEKKIIKYFEEINKQNTYLTNCKNYIESVLNQIDSYIKKIRICIFEKSESYYDIIKDSVNEIYDKIRSIFLIINQEYNKLSRMKNVILTKAKNIFTNIKKQININYSFIKIKNIYKNKSKEIKNKIAELEEITKILEKYLDKSNNKRKKIENNINELKIELEKFINNYKEVKSKINNDIKQSKRNDEINIFNSIKNSLNEEFGSTYIDEMEEVETIELDDTDLDDLKKSSLIGLKDFDQNINLFKSNYFFNNKNNLEEKDIKTPTILTKNWHETCYVYDDYDIYDVNFEIKAVGLSSGYFDSFSNSLGFKEDIEIINFEINGKKSDYYYEGMSIFYDIKLYNLQTNKIHIKYKKSQFRLSVNDFCKEDYYGLDYALSGQMAKYILILKGSFEIINFEKEFLIQNINNKKEKEYIWRGKVPNDGMRTVINFSKKEGNWMIKTKFGIHNEKKSEDNILNIYVNFIGGNNEIIDIDYYSPETKNIQIDEQYQFYEIKYKDSNFIKSDFISSIKLKNKCTGEWDINISDEEIEEYFPNEDKKDIEHLKKIAKKTIEEFDEKNDSIYYHYKDYQKIVKWVYENIKNDYSDSEEVKTALDIYYQKLGDIHNKTKLCNALLYSLGYKVLYAKGYVCRSNEDSDKGFHCWTLIKIDGKWYPLDAYYNIFSGKLPVSYIFENICNLNVEDTLIYNDDEFTLDSYTIDIRYLNDN